MFFNIEIRTCNELHMFVYRIHGIKIQSHKNHFFAKSSFLHHFMASCHINSVNHCSSIAYPSLIHRSSITQVRVICWFTSIDSKEHSSRFQSIWLHIGRFASCHINSVIHRLSIAHPSLQSELFVGSHR